jgi:two-component system sensor histidine kinase PilS (NtrC family)
VASSLRRKLLWLSSLRIVTLLFLVTATALFSGGMRPGFTADVQDTLMWVGLLGLVPSSLYFPPLLLIRSTRRLQALAIVQVTQDCLFAALMVASTGGTGSAFTFFFSLSIVVAGIVNGRMGTVYSIILSTILMWVIALLELGYVPVPGFLAAVLVPAGWNAVAYAVGLNCVAFISIGILSSYLAEQLRRSDIQRERFRANLEDLKQLHESILASVQTGIVTCRLDHRILHVNRAAEDLLGIDMNRSKGRNLMDVAPDIQTAIANYNGPFDIQRNWNGEVRYLRVSMIPLVSRVGAMIGRILDVSDITEVKDLEARIKSDERLATLGKLSAVVAHEIRNPLASISASAQLLSMAPAMTGEDRKALDIVVREAERLNSWITDLLDYARPKKGDVRGFDLAVQLNHVLELIKGDPSAEGIEIIGEIQPGLLVFGDEQRLHRVFLNLAKNAIEATVHGGQILIRARGMIEGNQHWIRVRVIDNGWGIPPDELPRIFDAFFTTKPRGTGLGLATVLQVVEEFGGTVNVSSVPNVRTEFEVRLPAAPPVTGEAQA